MTVLQQRNKAIRALRRIGISATEIAEVVGMNSVVVSRLTSDVHTRRLQCCQQPPSKVRVIGRQYGYNTVEPEQLADQEMP